MTSSYWTQPYPSRRTPVLAKNVVATSQPLATAAGLDALRRGGSAMDAAIAAAVTLTVVEPTSNGIGSDALAIVWDGVRLHGFNGSGRAPRALTLDRFAGRTAVPERGWDPVTVPGAVSCWVATHKLFGRLPFHALFKDAVRYADAGFSVSPITATAWARASGDILKVEGFREAFFRGDRAPEAGASFRFPEQARTLAAIAESAGESFYRGALAEAIVHAAQKGGGLITEADLANHECLNVEVLTHAYRDATLCELPPNTQGVAAQIALGIAAELGVDELPLDGADWFHLQIEAMKIALVDAASHIADPDHTRLDVRELLSQAYHRKCAATVRRDRAANPQQGIPARGGTVYLTAADERGMMVSFIQSNFMGFGSGVVVPGTGISLQNRGAGFTLDPTHPNVVAPGKRPFHTIIPGFALKGGAPDLSFGVMGGPMQAQGHLQMMLRIYGKGQNPQAASDAPRWRADGGAKLTLERGFPEDVARELADRGHHISFADSGAFGGAQLIQRHGDAYVAASDHRKDGHAAGY